MTDKTILPPGTSETIIHIGHDELIIRDRYEVASILNDIMIGIWFVIGSFLFLSPATTEAGTWLFIIGSMQMLVRPGIRLTRRVHLRRMPRMHGQHAITHEHSSDF